MKIKNRGFLKKIDGLITGITNMKKYSEILFMFVFAVYFYSAVAVISAVSFPIVQMLKSFSLILIPVAVILQLLTHMESKKELVIGVVLSAALWIISSYNGYEDLKYLGFLAAGSIGTDLKKLLKYVSIIGFAVIIVTFFATFALEPSLNAVYVGKRIRSTAGLGYPTNAASLVLYMSLMLFAAGGVIPTLAAASAGVVSLVLAAGYFNSNTSIICSVLFLLLLLYGALDEFLFRKFSHKWMSRIVQAGAAVAVPLAAAAIFVLSTLYGNGNAFAIRLNQMLHNRLRYTYEGISSIGISMIGKMVEIVGASAPGIGKSESYNFLDNSYVQIAVCYGMIAALIILGIWSYILFRAIKAGNRRIILVMIVIAVHSFEEHHFFDIAYNPLLFLPLAAGFEDETPVFEFKKPSARTLKAMAISAAALVVAVLISPIVFPATRAVVYKAGIGNEYKVSDRIEADRDALEIVISAHKKPVYADVLTPDYAKAFKGIKKSAYSGEDLVRKLDCTIVTDPDYSVAYFARGCLYARISDYTAIYTRDMSVADALIDAGYHVAGFYYEETQVEFNERFTTKSMPAFGSVGTITGEITLLGKSRNPDRVCMLEVNSAGASTATFIFKEQDFDENNVLKYNCEFKTGFGDVTFVVKALGGARLSVGDAVLSSNTIIDDQAVEFSFNNYYSDDFTLYYGKYRLDLEVKGTVEASEETSSLGSLKIARAQGNELTRDLAVSTISEDATYSFDFNFISKGTTVGFSIKPGDVADIESISGICVLSPSYDRHYTYDSKGRTTRIEYFDREGNRSGTRSGIFAFEYEYDKAGNKTATRYYDQNGELLQTSKGYAEVRKTYDALKHVTGVSYFGSDGEPVSVKKGYSSLVREVDVWGKVLSVEYYGNDGKPVMTRMGYARLRREYDDDGRITIERYYDNEGERCVLKQGYSGRRYEYDSNGNRTLIEYLDVNDRPVLIKKGYAQIHREYDDSGKVTVLYYADTQGHMITLNDGSADSYYTSATREYDEFGNCIVTRYFGKDTSAGYVEVRREFDAKNRVVYEGKFNSDGEGIVLKNKYSAHRMEYDDNDRLISEAFYGTDGEKMLLKSGYHKRCFEYDEQGNRTAIRYYGLEDEPVLYKKKYHALERDYDENGKVVAERKYDLEGNLIEN